MMEKLSEHPPEVEENDATEPKVEVNDGAKKKRPNIIIDKISTRPLSSILTIIGPIIASLALICTLFSITNEAVYRSMIPIFYWGCSPKPDETFFSTLESERVVRRENGKIHPPNKSNFFVKGECGHGFISTASKEYIKFPIKGQNLRNLRAGTVGLCVTLQQDLVEVTDELFFFMAYARRDDAIFLQFVDTFQNPIRRVARMRIKTPMQIQEGGGDTPRENGWVDADSEELDWKTGEHHRLVGTWGKDGVRLYIDGELIDHNPTTPAYPTKRPKVFVVNNDEADTGNNPTHCVVRNLRITNYQMSKTQVKEEFESLHPEK